MKNKTNTFEELTRARPIADNQPGYLYILVWYLQFNFYSFLLKVCCFFGASTKSRQHFKISVRYIFVAGIKSTSSNSKTSSRHVPISPLTPNECQPIVMSIFLHVGDCFKVILQGEIKLVMHIKLNWKISTISSRSEYKICLELSSIYTEH
jgi:hypothetical protein